MSVFQIGGDNRHDLFVYQLDDTDCTCSDNADSYNMLYFNNRIISLWAFNNYVSTSLKFLFGGSLKIHISLLAKMKGNPDAHMGISLAACQSFYSGPIANSNIKD